MEETNGGGKSYKDKLHEPILNPIQVFILLGIIIFEVVTNILPLLMGMDINPIWVMVTMTGGIAAFAVTSLLRAAYPEEVPDTRITTAFKMFIKQIVDALITNQTEQSELKILLERIIVWAVREWDVIYQMELAEAVEYARKNLFPELIEPEITREEEIEKELSNLDNAPTA